MDCSYCGNQVDEAAEFFDVTHHVPWEDETRSVVFCSYECVRGYLHAEHFEALFPRSDGPTRDPLR